MGGSPASLNTQHTLPFPFYITLVALVFGAFAHSLLYILSTENRESAASNIRLELSTF